MALKKTIAAFALGTPDIGCQNQLIGAISVLQKKSAKTPAPEKCFLLPLDISELNKMTKPISYNQFRSYKLFREEIFKMLDKYMSKATTIPQVFITAYNLTESNTPEKNIDNICRAVKEYYKEHDLGNILTSVLLSKSYNYKYVDLINVPKHLLTFYSRLRLLKNKKQRKRTLITVGTIHKFTPELVKEKKAALESSLKIKTTSKIIQSQINKIKEYIAADKRIAICLGGRVEGQEIVFNINYAKSLLENCQTLSRQGYYIAIVNGPRTPNDVTDYLYQNTKKDKNILFHNCKKIAKTEEERKMWRIYSGKYEKDFKEHSKIGNIYPGILGYPNTLSVHTIDSYSSCETISAGIPTAISYKGIYINPHVRMDCINLYNILTPKHALDFDEFINLACYMKIEPNHLTPSSLTSPLRIFEQAIRNRLE